MGETEFKIFIVLINLILFVFIGGIIVFFLKYHKRKLINETEKSMLNEMHAQEMLSAKLDVQQQVMQDIGREIHDNVGQLLTVASLYAHQIVYENQHPGNNDQINEIGKIVDESLVALRTLSRNLLQQNIAFHELAETLQQECKRINALNICEVKCSFNEVDYPISTAINNILLRISQEFIQNSLKHAACKHITISFHHDSDGLAVHLKDDGTGFKIAPANNSGRGIGIGNMQKRAEMVGATFLLKSELQKGTFLDIFIPAGKLNYF